MSIYVDEAVLPFRGELWCHMATDGDLSELHQMAETIGLKRKWFQNRKGLPHYDLSPAMRVRACLAGAVQVKATVLWQKCKIKTQPSGAKIVLKPVDEEDESEIEWYGSGWQP